MATKTRRQSIRAVSIWLLAAVLMALVTCTEEAGTDIATSGTSKEPASTFTSPAPVASQPTATDTATAEVSKDGDSTKSNPTPVDPQDAGVLYAQCIRDNGVPNFPDPGPDGRFAISHGEGGINQGDPSFRAALEECRDLAPGGDHRNTGDPAYVEEMRAFSQCMRDNGLPDFPDPDAEGRLRGLGHEAQGNPKYRAAMEVCAGSLPGGGAHR